jgi:hypothetical protein
LKQLQLLISQDLLILTEQPKPLDHRHLESCLQHTHKFGYRLSRKDNNIPRKRNHLELRFRPMLAKQCEKNAAKLSIVPQCLHRRERTRF